jgi:hypothetical protein
MVGVSLTRYTPVRLTEEGYLGEDIEIQSQTESKQDADDHQDVGEREEDNHQEVYERETDEQNAEDEEQPEETDGDDPMVGVSLTRYTPVRLTEEAYLGEDIEIQSQTESKQDADDHQDVEKREEDNHQEVDEMETGERNTEAEEQPDPPMLELRRSVRQHNQSTHPAPHRQIVAGPRNQPGSKTSEPKQSRATLLQFVSIQLALNLRLA